MVVAKRTGYLVSIPLIFSILLTSGCNSLEVQDDAVTPAPVVDAATAPLTPDDVVNSVYAVESDRTEIGVTHRDHLSPGDRDELMVGMFETGVLHAGEPAANEEQGFADLWDRIRHGFALNHDHQGIQRDLDWYTSHQEYLNRVVERARPYLHYIVTETEKRDMPLEIALLPVVESAFQAFAYSHGRAAGLWQFIPGTGRLYGLKQNWWYDGRRDVWASTQAALDYLQALKRELGDWELALAAYNAGAGNVRKAIRKSKRRGRGTDFWSLIPYLPKETRGYVPKLLAISAVVADPEKYGVTIAPIANAPVLARVQLDGQIDLALAAEMADISIEELYNLNPAYNRWATDPNGSNHLLIPLAREANFREELATLPPEKRIQWQRHRIRKGETLLSIADHYNTTVRVIKKVNRLRGNTIRQGRNLIIPVAMKETSAYTHTADKRRSRIQNTERAGRIKKTYRVRDGDSFWSISRKFGVGVQQLARWNGMAPRDTLSVGQKLVVWSKRSSRRLTSIDDSVLVQPPGSQTKRWINYVVRRGDSLSTIADRFRVSIGQLKRWNAKVKTRKYLQPGQRLKLYVDVTRQSS